MRRRCVVYAMLTAAAAAQTPLTLEQAEQAALKNHPQIGASVFNALVAREVTREIRAGLLPNLSGSVTGVGGQDGTRIGAGTLTAGSIYNRVSSGVTASQLMYDFGRTSDLVASSRLRADAQVQNTQATRELVVLQVDRAYFAALRARAVLRVAEQTVAARQLVVDQVTALARSALKSTLDVTFAQVNLSEAKLLLAQAQSDIQAASSELSTAMGMAAPVADWQLAEMAGVGEQPVADVAPLVQEALKRRPEVASARLEFDAARKLIAAERALSLPTISAIATAGVLPAHTDKITGNYSGAGVNVNIPVFNGHAFSARRAQAEYRASGIEQNLRDLENRVSRDVTVAWLNQQNSWQRLALTAELLDRANQALDLAQARYDLGLSAIVELSQAQLAKTNAELQAAAAKYEFQAQSAMLKFQAGTLLP